MSSGSVRGVGWPLYMKQPEMTDSILHLYYSIMLRMMTFPGTFVGPIGRFLFMHRDGISDRISEIKCVPVPWIDEENPFGAPLFDLFGIHRSRSINGTPVNH